MSDPKVFFVVNNWNNDIGWADTLSDAIQIGQSASVTAFRVRRCYQDQYVYLQDNLGARSYADLVPSSTILEDKQSLQATNDRVCLVCGNDRCSSSEVSCWKCGGAL